MSLYSVQCIHHRQFVDLFVKLPPPGDGEMTFVVFESSCHLSCHLFSTFVKQLAQYVMP